MVNLAYITKGVGVFLATVFISILAYQLILVLAGVVNDVSDENAIGDSIEAIIWFGVILVWVLGTLAIPAHYYYKGLTEEDDLSPISKSLIGIIIFIFGILLTVKGWYLAPAIASFLDTTLQIILFWIGLILTWATIVIATPFYCILDATQR